MRNEGSKINRTSKKNTTKLSNNNQNEEGNNSKSNAEPERGASGEVVVTARQAIQIISFLFFSRRGKGSREKGDPACVRQKA